MYIQTLRLENWGPYYGVHEIELRDTVYAVQAQHADDPQRSNWLGKSWFLGAIRFLLTGVKPETCLTADGWISRGAKLGSVGGVLSDGTVINRSRKLGASTQLTVKHPGQQEAKQDSAQVNLERLIGMDHDDLMATSFIEQRQIARLVLADPAKRTEIVNGWLQLGQLERAEDWLKVQLNKLYLELGSLPRALDVPEGHLLNLEAEINSKEGMLSQSIHERQEYVNELTALAEWQQHQANAERFAEVRELGIQTKAEIEKLDKVVADNAFTIALERMGKADVAFANARDQERDLRELVFDEWDGKCPKTCSDCPVASDVRKFGKTMQVELTVAESKVDQAHEALDQARRKFKYVEEVRTQRDKLQSRIESYREQATELLHSVDVIEEKGAPPDGDEIRQTVAELDQIVASAQSALDVVVAEYQRHKAASDAYNSSLKRREELERQIHLHQEAVTVVGRRGAQREVAEGALAEIQSGANRLLSSAGIDLTLRVSWGREGKDLASNCDMCGAGFPKSATVKACAVCGQARGPKVVEKLLLLPSDRSGAADDIAGLAFQLAASSWLRTKRSSAWAVACIDEPFGQLDKANSRALSSHLHAMIRGSFAFEQGFLVAHDASVMESLPAKVLITADAQGSTLLVES